MTAAAVGIAAVTGCAGRSHTAVNPTPSAPPTYVIGTLLTPPTPSLAAPHRPRDTAPPAEVGAAATAGLREVFPHVRADIANKLVEFDAVVSPLLVKDERAPLFYLEVVACTPDTREHETLVVSQARPSHVHAAMLLIGLKPGESGGWKFESGRLEPVDASGDRVEIRFALTDAAEPGRTTEADPLDWIVSVRDGRSIRDAAAAADGRATSVAAAGWVFAGSHIVSGQRAATPIGDEPREVYEADQSGTLIGLATFGGETISWSRTFSPDASVDAPEWIAKLDATPPAGTPVLVRIRPAR